nr:lipopolysaccharide biosynthesis protein [Clostridium sp. CAG:221]
MNFFSKYSNIFIQLLLNSILARLLTPDDYGIVAIITVFISFFTVIADMGIGPAIIQHKDLSKKQISDIFIFTVFVGLLVSIGFILFSYPLAMFYDNRVYISLGIILSIGIFFNVVNMVPNALLLKDKQFKALGIRTVVITIIGGIITIILAIKGAKYYALVINSVFVGFLTFVFNYWYSKINIYWGFSLESIKKIKEFSSYQFGFNFINYFSRNSDNLLIGKFMGEVALGYYDKAYRLMLYPVQNLTHVITPVLHPILSDYQDDYDKIYSQYVKVVKILSLLGVFILVFCFFSAKEIILRN